MSKIEIKDANGTMPKQPAPPLILPDALMFIDIEWGPDQSYIWLISVLVEDKPESSCQFYAKTPAGEKKVLENFLAYHERYGGCVMCYYGGHDERLTNRQIATHGLDGSKLGSWFDMHPAIKKCSILRGRYSALKEVGKEFKYEFRHPCMDGTRATAKYADNICEQDEHTTKMLLEYGGDDVLAMQHVLSCVSRIATLDRSWKPPEHALPPTFEEQCSILKSLKHDQGLTIARIAERFGCSRNYVCIRLHECPEKKKGKKVSFDWMFANETGIKSDGSQDKCWLRRTGRANGEVVEQISENLLRIKVDGAIFQVHKDALEWE